ncbi:MAG TPA: T9SS type A sorting domain-containing protein [Chitinophagales bacterium]|nr:T9SS type A sorting domain-containing protein [Chitinophagales bacterium]
MKTVLLCLSLFVASAVTAFGQCCPYIDGVEIFPEMATDEDSVYVVTTVTTPNLGAYLGETHTVIGDTILIDACYYSGMLTALQTYVDTINVGLLAPGTYVVRFIARISSDANQCVPTGQMQDSVLAPFTVTVTNALQPVHQGVVKLYPNPASDRIHISLGGSHEIVSVMNALGATARPRLVLAAGDMATLDVSDLPDGIYTVSLRDESGALIHRSFVKE